MQSLRMENLFSLSCIWMDDILLASSDIDLLLETKKFLSSKFDMNDLGEASFVLELKFTEMKEKGY